MKCIGYLVAVVLLTATLASAEIKNKGWWKHTVFYQIYPRSFMDSNNDGIGDLKGITSKLQHFKDIGVGAIWLSPINKSPKVDFGYDISDFRDIDADYGNLADLEELIKEAHEIGLKVILDLVPNHTSDQHEWFKWSVNKTGKYADYYIWSDGIKKGNETVPPNNWVSVFNGSGWTYHETRKQYYFHQFYKQQPDLNYNNTDVQQEMKDIIKFWLDKGMDGFRVDAVPHLVEGDINIDEPKIDVPGANYSQHPYLNHTQTKDQPATYKIVQSWRDYVDQYANERDIDEKVLLTEAYTSWENTLKYYKYGAHVPFNFKFITDVGSSSTATQFKKIIDDWMRLKPNGTVANWVMGNHDRTRIGTRYPNRTDQMTMLAMILPGVAVTYYGEEIGMVDYPGLNISDFRDGCRTPFQWDDSVNAGFNKGHAPWLPVNTNYKDLNLKKEKGEDDSHYHVYKTLTSLRQSDVLKNGILKTVLVNDEVLAVVRNASGEAVTLLINFSNEDDVTLDLQKEKLVLSGKCVVETASVDSGLKKGTTVSISDLKLPKKASVVLSSTTSSDSSIASYSLGLVLTMAAALMFQSY